MISRKTVAQKNYYQGLQLAHIINELLVLSQALQELLTCKMTLKLDDPIRSKAAAKLTIYT